MSGAIMDKVWGLFGMDSAEPEEDDEENVYDLVEEEQDELLEDKRLFGKRSKISFFRRIPHNIILYRI